MTLDSKALLDGTHALSDGGLVTEAMIEAGVLALDEYPEGGSINLPDAVRNVLLAALATRPPVKGDSVELVERLADAISQAFADWFSNVARVSGDELDLRPVIASALESSGHTALSERVVVLEGVLSETFDFLGGCDGAAELRDRILAALKGCDALGGGE